MKYFIILLQITNLLSDVLLLWVSFHKLIATQVMNDASAKSVADHVDACSKSVSENKFN